MGSYPTEKRNQVQTELLEACRRLLKPEPGEIPIQVTYKGVDARDLTWGELLGLVEILSRPKREIRIPAEKAQEVREAIQASHDQKMIILPPDFLPPGVCTYTVDPAGVRGGSQ